MTMLKTRLAMAIMMTVIAFFVSCGIPVCGDDSSRKVLSGTEIGTLTRRAVARVTVFWKNGDTEQEGGG